MLLSCAFNMTRLTHSAAPTQRVYSLSQAISAFTLIANRIMSYPASPFNGFLQLPGYRMDTHASLTLSLQKAFLRWLHLSLAFPCSCLSVPNSASIAHGSHAGEAFCHNLCLLARASSQTHLDSSFRDFSWETSLGKSCQMSPGQVGLFIIYTLPPSSLAIIKN